MPRSVCVSVCLSVCLSHAHMAKTVYFRHIHCIQEKKRQTEIYFLKYLLQNSGDSDEILYTVS